MEHTILITAADAEKLREAMREAKLSGYRNSPYLRQLAGELYRANVVAPNALPADVVTMNSKVRLVDLETGEEMIYTLAFPEDADLAQGKISVLAPIGTAMLGYRAGDTFAWETPGGVRQIKVAEILFQPEAAGINL